MIEVTLDQLAAELGMDPLELRRRELHQGRRVPARGRRSASSTTPATTRARSPSCSSTSTSTQVRAEAEELRPKGILRGIGFCTWTGDLRPRAVARRRPGRLRPADRHVGVGDGARARHRRRHRLHRHLAARPGAGDDVRADRGRPARRRPAQRRGHPRRHRHRPARPGHLRLALAGGRRRGDRPRDRQGRRQGQEDRRPQARGGARGHRAARTASSPSRARPTRA